MRFGKIVDNGRAAFKPSRIVMLFSARKHAYAAATLSVPQADVRFAGVANVAMPVDIRHTRWSHIKRPPAAGSRS
jgi:hypothetical protein